MVGVKKGAVTERLNIRNCVLYTEIYKLGGDKASTLGTANPVQFK